MSTPEFKSIDSFIITGRGTVYMVPNPTDCRREELRRLVRTTVRIDGVERVVLGVDSHATFTISAGVSIGLLVADPGDPGALCPPWDPPPMPDTTDLR